VCTVTATKGVVASNPAALTVQVRLAKSLVEKVKMLLVVRLR
jgi:hypothetical protein